jgi:potassium-transporting ATPase KdpC subunit
MNNKVHLGSNMMNHIISSGKSMLLTLLICCILYPSIILMLGHIFIPFKAEGSLIKNNSGITIGSELIGQKFTSPSYFWSRPSAVDYNAAGSGGSNLATTNPALRERMQKSIAMLDNHSKQQIPLDMVTASGSGLDPEISIEGAYYQADRVAHTRKTDVQNINKLIKQSVSKSDFNKSAIVNVLELNMLLDKEIPYHE